MCRSCLIRCKSTWRVHEERHDWSTSGLAGPGVSGHVPSRTCALQALRCCRVMRASSGACRVDPRLVSQAWHPAPPCSNRASLSTRTRLDYAAHTLSSLVTATPGRADSACRALHPAATLPVTKTRPAGPPGLPPSCERVMRAGGAVHGAGPGPGCAGRSISQGHAVSRRMCLEPGALSQGCALSQGHACF